MFKLIRRFLGMCEHNYQMVGRGVFNEESYAGFFQSYQCSKCAKKYTKKLTYEV